MLKYKLNIKKQKNNIVEVKYDSLYLSPDGSYITGVTDTSYCLSQENYITVVSNETQECLLDATDIICCGYVIYNKVYKVEIFENVVGILYNDGQYYCVDIDFNRETVTENDNELTNSVKHINPFIIIDNKEYEIGKYEGDTIIWHDNVKIPTKYWSYNNKITIDDVTYDVIIDNKTKLINDENYYPYIVLNDLDMDDVDRVLYVIDWEYSKRHNKTIFKIYSKNSNLLQIEKANCVDKFIYYNNKLVDGTSSKIYLENYDNESAFWEECINKNQVIESEWRNVKESNIIDLYLNGSTNNILYNSIIYVKPHYEFGTTLKSNSLTNDNKIVFSYYGREYICEKNDENKKKYVVIQDVEYEIHSVVKDEVNNVNSYFIIFNSMPLSITINDNIASMESPYDKNNFDIISHYFISINGKEYKITVTENGQYTVTLDDALPLCLQINYFIGNNILRCTPLDNENLVSLLSSISNDHNNFTFEISCPIFDTSLVKPYTFEDKKYISSDITLLCNHSSFTIPIKLESDNALNLHKDFLIKQSYLDETTSGLINRIVDMEKDIYYPARIEEKGGEDVFTLCHKIQIDLHFRTRNLDTWVVNDVNNRYEYGTENKTNWNLFDSYRYSIDDTIENSFRPILKLKDDLKYFPPSDLLHFLNFTDEDVNYQKQKIGKSFLRLSFYDSPDPNKQSLLYTSTIFMSETSLYQKYINADKTLTHYVTLRERGKLKEKNIVQNGDTNDVISSMIYSNDDLDTVKRIGVHTEPCESSKKKNLTFDEDKRLSSTFIIKNRHETIDSSEGFYLYLFKEYSNWLHERTIYMRVQFNHAGLGKTVNFMIMYHKNANGNKSMINWSLKYNFDRYKDGYTLSELYEHIYIEIKVKYDLENKRFCYYLPKWMSEKNSNKNVMHLSLFEIKIKDESNP